ncbi:mitochondrial 37S ribosomal protein uS5m [Calcarisporiella thermophila]|uniref:mitochondrial 37S ribosomal protein uS5m n=1 Tax=Calcarisporiella thermophila TaxID=911321 RepID=UPI0037429DEF
MNTLGRSLKFILRSTPSVTPLVRLGPIGFLASTERGNSSSFTTYTPQHARRRVVHPLVPTSNLSHIDPILDFPTEMPALDAPSLYTRQPPPALLDTDTDEIDPSSTPLTRDEIRRLQKKVLIVKRVVNQTRKGKIPSMYALVVVGNGQGLAGYGEGKHEEAARAVRKATHRAIKSVRYFDRYDNRTIYHDIQHKFGATELNLRARPPGFGNRANHYVHEICRCIGIQDISGKVWGSRNPMNVIKATFEALQQQKLPEDIAKGRGKRLVDVQHVYYGSSQ